jgi:general stress protein 26
MAVAKRTGPDFLFLANAHSQKFNDLENGPPEVNVSFINSSNQDWVSVTGECVTSDNADPRIKEVWSKGTKAWFGDLGDGVHTGGPEDPRMKLIEIKAKRKSTESICCTRIRGQCTDLVAQTSHTGSTRLADLAS